MKINNIYFTADWHLWHKNILKLDNRPFQDINHMRNVLINNYNSTVTDSDICYFLGDMGLCSKGLMEPIIKQLKGTKILLLGNHDKGTNSMMGVGFDIVLYGATLKIANNKVTMSHCPLMGIFMEDVAGMRGAKEGDNWHGEHKNGIYSTTDQGQFHLHGHRHAKIKEHINGKQFNVSVTAHNYRPVNISVIESWIAKYEKKK